MAKAATKTAIPAPIRTFTRTLAVILTADEVMQAGHQLAETIQDINAEQRRQDDMKAQMKARLAELAAKQTRLAIMVTRVEDFRDVEIQAIVNGKGLVDEIRTDTKEIINTRPLLDEERQRMLALQDGAKGEKENKEKEAEKKA
jgi:hypothetical protein